MIYGGRSPEEIESLLNIKMQMSYYRGLAE